MSLRKHGLAAGGLVLGAALALTACSSGSSGGGSSAGTGGAGGTFSVGLEKFQALTPSNCYDLYCAQVNRALFTGLFQFTTDSSGALTPTNTELTKSLNSPDDGKTWEIELNPGFTFTNGEKVTAQTFVDTYNYAANGDNGQQLGFIFGPGSLDVQGYQDVADGKSKAMSGIKAKSEYLLSITLNAAMTESLFKNFITGPQILPMPSEAFKDPAKYEKQPIGNGPYKLTGPYNNQGLSVVKNADYAGTAGNADQIDFKIYADSNAYWADLQANTLDVTNNLPQNALATAPQVLGDRYLNTPNGLQYSFFGFPANDPTFKEKDVRIGIAKSINWDEINQKLYYGTRQTATSFAPSSIPGGGQDVCGDKCTFDAAKAKELIQGAGGVPGNTVRIPQLSNETGDVQKAICNQIQTNTGVTCTVEMFKDFGEMLDVTQNGKAPNGTMVGSGWVADNPTIQNMIYFFWTSDSPGNVAQYKNPQFDKLLKEGVQAKSDEEQIAKWQEAEKVLYEDFPGYAYQFRNQVGGYSTNVSNVSISPDGLIDLNVISVNS